VSTHRSDLLRSLGGELEAQASRVRDLIGASHWLSDGIHKEALLAAVIDRHLPAATLLTHGFLLSASRPSICSKEVDLLLLDLASEGPVFRQSALAMGLARQALAAVSVKATCTSSNIGESVENLASARVVLAVDNVPDRLWCGAFFYMLDSSYNEDPTKIYARLGATLRQHSVPLHPNGGPPGLQAICAGPDHFFAIHALGWPLVYSWPIFCLMLHLSVVA
jgi:hypothetical protein